MAKSSIEWTDETWNPVTGCSKVSPGCAHCYAEAVTQRFATSWGVSDLPWTPANAHLNVAVRGDRLEQPLHWRHPRMVFVNSMSDLFHDEVPDWFIAQVWSVMANCPQHTFQVLTKRPERMQRFVRRLTWAHPMETGSGWRADLLPDDRWTMDDEPASPLPNVWLGVSIENRRFVHRADELRATPAAVRFISAEPLLGPLRAPWNKRWVTEDGHTGWCSIGTELGVLPDLHLNGIDWLIVGGESGPRHRLMSPEWVRALRDAAGLYGTAFFFKQWGGRTPKSGGRELDGRTWDEMPAALAEVIV
jgi:protein gp37